MNSYPKTLILRHRKENLRKCSLRGLESHGDLLFYTYPKDPIYPKEPYVTLSFKGPCLSKNDTDCGIFLIDSTWRYEKAITKKHAQHLQERSLPKGIQTAYPRKQDDCIDPTRGLASVEALYVAHLILGRSCDAILDHYHFKGRFLEKNKTLLREIKHAY